MRAVSETALRCGLDETSQKVDSGTHKQLLEAGAFMGRSCRVGWGPGNSRFSVVPAASATAGNFPWSCTQRLHCANVCIVKA